MGKEKDYFLKYGKELEKRYAGKYIAVVDDKVIVVGNSRFEVYQKATKDIPPDKKVGIFYLPLKEEVLTAL